MNGKALIVCVVGTRPEVIKMAPVILALRQAEWAKVRVVATAQHRGLLDQAMADFGIVPDLDLDLMQENQTLAVLTARLIEALDAVLANESPALVLAQGDTTTVLATAMCCFYRDIPFGHVEAGLRTHQRRLPFPEEMNRVFVSYLASLHFAPTDAARRHLVAEGVASDAIHLVGNTVIDALHYQAGRAAGLQLPIDLDKRTILVTAHRRESFGAPMEELCESLVDIVRRHGDVQIFFPVHPNPNVGRLVRSRLAGIERVVLSDALDYPHFVAAMQRSFMILTDSGGVQEEAPALGKPVLVLREQTERPEAVDAGVVKLVGHDRATVVEAVDRLLTDPEEYAEMAKGASPYGDGHSAARIVAAIRGFLNGPGKSGAGRGFD